MILEEAEREKSAAIRNKLIAELGGDPNDVDSVSSVASKSIHVEDIMKEFDTFGDKSKSTIHIQSKRDYKTVKPDYDSAAGDELPEPSETESIKNSDKIGGLLYDNKVRKPTKKKRKAAVSKSRSKSNNRSKKPEESKSQSKPKSKKEVQNQPAKRPATKPKQKEEKKQVVKEKVIIAPRKEEPSESERSSRKSSSVDEDPYLNEEEQAAELAQMEKDMIEYIELFHNNKIF